MKLQSVKLVYVVILGALIFALYWPGAYGPLLLDDEKVLGGMLSGSAAATKALVFDPSGPFGRPISMFSFYANSLFSTNVFYWKLTNIAFHVANAILFFVLSALVFKKFFTLQRALLLAMISAGLWAIHPMHISTVLYLVQRMTELSALFTLLFLIFYILCRDGVGWARIPLGLGSAVSFIFAVLAKENALAAVLLVPLVEYFLYQSRRFFWVGCGIIASAGFGLFLMHYGDNLLTAFDSRPFTLGERVFTEFRVLAEYLRMLFVPSVSAFGFFHDDIVFSTGLFVPLQTLWSALFILGLFVAALFLASRQPLLSFGIFWFFITISLESSIFPLELMYEHRTYLPSMGLAFGLVAAISGLVKSRVIHVGAGILVVASFLFVSWMRVGYWSSFDLFMLNAERAHPTSPRVVSVLSAKYVNYENYSLAREKLGRLTVPGARLQEAHIGCKETGSIQLAHLSETFGEHLDNYAAIQINQIVNDVMDGDCDANFGDLYSLLLDAANSKGFSSNRYMYLLYAGHINYRMGHYAEAITTYERAFVSGGRKSPYPLILAADLALELGHQDEFNRLLALLGGDGIEWNEESLQDFNLLRTGQSPGVLSLLAEKRKIGSGGLIEIH